LSERSISVVHDFSDWHHATKSQGILRGKTKDKRNKGLQTARNSTFFCRSGDRHVLPLLLLLLLLLAVAAAAELHGRQLPSLARPTLSCGHRHLEER